MAAETLLPPSFWFKLALESPRVDSMPGAKGGPLLNLPERSRLPDFALLAGSPSWVTVATGWNAGGLGICFEARNPVPAEGKPARSGAGRGSAPALGESQRLSIATVDLWVDTRDTRTISRASRFCHYFRAEIRSNTSGSVGVQLDQQPIPRATAEAPMGREADRLVRADRSATGWRLELFFKSAALNGFDPDTNRRLGLSYRVHEVARGDAWMGVGDDFQLPVNPGLWSTLVLVD